MESLEELKHRKFEVICTEPHVYCKSFEKNSGASELAKLPKMRPHTRHISVCYHHFHEHIRNSLIKIFPVDMKDQIFYQTNVTKILSQKLLTSPLFLRNSQRFPSRHLGLIKYIPYEKPTNNLSAHICATQKSKNFLEIRK